MKQINEEVLELISKGPIVADTLIKKQQLLIGKAIGILALVLEQIDADKKW